MKDQDAFNDLVDDLFDLDKENPYLGQTIDPEDDEDSAAAQALKFDKDQPRVAAGTPEGGRFTSVLGLGGPLGSTRASALRAFNKSHKTPDQVDATAAHNAAMAKALIPTDLRGSSLTPGTIRWGNGKPAPKPASSGGYEHLSGHQSGISDLPTPGSGKYPDPKEDSRGNIVVGSTPASQTMRHRVVAAGIAERAAAALSKPDPLVQSIAEGDKSPLQEASVKSTHHGALEGGANASYLVEMSNGMQAVYKPESGERWKGSFANHDIPRYITNRKLSLAERESMAYEVDSLLGTKLVPETVLRKELDLPGVGKAGHASESSGGDPGRFDEHELRGMYDEYRNDAFQNAHEAAGSELNSLYQEAQDEHVKNINKRVKEMGALWDEVVEESPKEKEHYGSPTMQAKHPRLPMSPSFRRNKKTTDTIDPADVLKEADVNLDGSLNGHEKVKIKEILHRMRNKEGYKKLGSVDEEKVRDNFEYEGHEDTENKIIDKHIMSFTAWRNNNGYSIGGSSDHGGGSIRNDQAPHPKGGSLQRFVPDMTRYGTMSPVDAQKFAVLDYALGTMDRHGGNVLFNDYSTDDDLDGVNEHHHLTAIAIDNGYSMPGPTTTRPDGFIFRSHPVSKWIDKQSIDPQHHSPEEEASRKEMLEAVTKTDWKALADRHPAMSKEEREAFLGRMTNLGTALETKNGLYTLWYDQRIER